MRTAKRFIYLFVILTVVLMSGCNRQVGPGTDPNTLQAWIDKPLHDSIHPFGSINVLAHGSAYAELQQIELSFSPKGSDQRTLVETKAPGIIYQVPEGRGNQSTLLGQANWSWTPPGTGEFTLYIRVRGSNNVWSDYARADVVIIPPQFDRDGLTQPQPADDSPKIEATFTVTPTATPTLTATPTDTPTPHPTLPPAELVKQSPSTNKVYYEGTSCSPQNVTFRVRASHPYGIDGLLFFYRLRDQSTGNQTGWSSGDTMFFEGDGLYSLIRSGNQLAQLGSFDGTNATVSYQFVLQPSQGETVRSAVFNDLTLSKCITIIIPGPINTPTVTVK